MTEQDEVLAWLEGIADLTHGTDGPAARLAPIAMARIKQLTLIADYAYQCVALDEFNDSPWDEAWERLKESVKDYKPMQVDPLLVALVANKRD